MKNISERKMDSKHKPKPISVKAKTITESGVVRQKTECFKSQMRTDFNVADGKQGKSNDVLLDVDDDEFCCMLNKTYFLLLTLAFFVVAIILVLIFCLSISCKSDLICSFFNWKRKLN